MEFKKVVLASFMALSLVACGDSDDTSKPDDSKTKIPEKDQACIDAGDLCKLENGKWVVHKKDEDKKPDDNVPVADGSFDYSSIGLTDKLLPERRGFAFYHKGAKSPLDKTQFKTLTLSPTIHWSSDREYDVDLYNFVAIKEFDPENPDKEDPVRFMFDKIGEENHKVNQNLEFFGNGAFATHSGSPIGVVGTSSYDSTTKTYDWNTIPAVVNTYMFRKNNGALDYVYGDPKKKLFKNQEEETKSTMGSGQVKLRVYGVNAFLEKETANYGKLLDPHTKKAGISTGSDDDLQTYSLTERGDDVYEHVNYVWYNLGDLGKKKKRAEFKINESIKTQIDYKLPVALYADNEDPFPTDVEFGVLKSVQFGRLTGEGMDPQSEDIAGYNKKNLKKYPFTTDVSATAGNKKAEDWYFARGTEPTPISTLDQLKSSATGTIGYDGQALMFGLDYTPTKPVKKAGAKETDQSTNSVKPAAPDSKVSEMLLDGKQNFVRMEWNPSKGTIEGKVFGVWTRAKYWRKVDNGIETVYKFKTPKEGDVTASDDLTALKWNASAHKQPADGLLTAIANAILEEIKTDEDSLVIGNNAIEMEPYIYPLVEMKGTVTEGTNAFGGKAIRVKDGSSGLFTGGFFGPGAKEIGGVINSQVDVFTNKDLVDPGQKWGGSFGARNQDSEQEDLLFLVPNLSISTSTEAFEKK